MYTSSKLRVGVLFGGRSSEHEVSLVSAQSIIKALDPQKYEIIPIGISKRGNWIVGVEPQKFLSCCSNLQISSGPYNSQASEITNVNNETNSTITHALIGDPTNKGLIVFSQNGTQDKLKVDVIFPVVHGTYGEDGTLQGLLEMADIPYVGCGVLASALGMDKTTAKKLFIHAGLNVARFKEYLRNDIKSRINEIMVDIEESFGYPCFVKPVNCGSSVGVSKVHNQHELKEALVIASKYDRKILVEEFINGREIEVSVLGNDNPISSIPGEVVPCREFYDYQAKYIDNRSELHIPAQLTPEQTQEVRELAIIAYKALDCAGMARVDFFLERNTGKWYVNEINTIPGFTSISMYPKLWEATGIKYSDLLDKLISLALERYYDKQETLKSLS